MSLNSSLTAVGSVKYNAQRDVVDCRRRRLTKSGADQKTFYGNNTSDECLSIMPRELCLRHRVKSTRKRLYTDTDMNVFSSANSLYCCGADEDARIQLRDSLDFGGIAVTKSDSAEGNQNNELVVLFGGTATIRNTGPQPIYSGQYVMWDLPAFKECERARFRSEAVPREKILFETRPFTFENKFPSNHVSLPKETKTAIEELHNAIQREDNEEFLKAFRKVDTAFEGGRRRVIGRALSSAETGKEFDLVLGRYMS